MGDRSNVFVQMEPDSDDESRWSGIGIYAHWHGVELHEIAIKAADIGKSRLGDESYFTRRVVQLVLNELNPTDSETGAGLWISHPPDNEHPILVINARSGKTAIVSAEEPFESQLWRNSIA